MLHINESFYVLNSIIIMVHNKIVSRKRKKFIGSECLPYNGSIVYGDSYGVVTITRLCNNCHNIHYYDYFFRQRDYDEVYINNMEPILNNDNNIEITLPNGDIGIFSLVKKAHGFNDEYVREILCDVNYVNDNEDTLKHVFRTIESEIKLRTAWKKLYFRCFRKSYSPYKKNGKKNIEMGKFILSNILNHKYSL